MVDTAATARRRWGTAAAVLFVVLSALWTAGALNFGSAWIKTGSARTINSILGYSETERHNVVHKENRSFLQQISMFSGATTDVVDKFYVVRPTYAYLAAFLAPVLGIPGAALAMNWIGWAAAAWCAWHLALRLHGDPLAGFLAVAFVATGMGFTVHIADYSAHLLAFTTYYLGIVVLIGSGMWERRQGLAVHLAIGAFLALCCLTYNMGLALVIGYVVASLRHNRWLDVLLVAGLAFTAQYAWVAALNLGYALKTGDWTWYDLYANDSGYFSGSMLTWLALWSNPLDGLWASIRVLLQFLSFEFPLTVACGLVALALMFRSDRRQALLFLVLFALPILGAMAYAQRAAARGYLVFGISLIVFAALAGTLARGLRDARGWRRTAAAALAAVLLLGQVAWSGAHFLGHLGPLRSYYLGIERAVDELSHGATEVVSLTGREPTPAWFGGTAAFDQLGLHAAAGPQPAEAGYLHRLAVSLGARALPSLYLALLMVFAWAAAGLSVWRAALGSVVVIYLLPSTVMAALVRETYRFVPIDAAGPDVECRALRYAVNLSDDFRRRAASADPQRVHLELFFQPASRSRQPPEVALNGHRLTVVPAEDAGRWLIKDEHWPQRLGGAASVEVGYRFDGEARYLGWQRPGLAGRHLSFDDCTGGTPGATVLPAVELRVVTARGAPLLVGF